MTKRSSPQTRFLALGDSYTFGEGVDPSHSWPVQLATRIRAQGVEVKHPTVIARTGWTTGDLLTAIELTDPQGSFDLVTLLIGVNNQYRGEELDAYQEEFNLLLTKAIGFAGSDPTCVIVISIPDWGVTPFAKGRDRKQISLEIDQFNDLNWKVSQATGVNYLDVTPVSRQAGNDPTLLAPDQLHPSEKMYAAWVSMLIPLLPRNMHIKE